MFSPIILWSLPSDFAIHLSEWVTIRVLFLPKTEEPVPKKWTLADQQVRASELSNPTPGEDVRQGKPPEVYGKKPPVKFAIFVNGKVCMYIRKKVAVRQLREDQMGYGRWFFKTPESCTILENRSN